MYFSSVTSVPLMKCVSQLENRMPLLVLDCRLQTQHLFSRVSLSGRSRGGFAWGRIYVKHFAAKPFNSCFSVLAIVSPLAGRGANESL